MVWVMIYDYHYFYFCFYHYHHCHYYYYYYYIIDIILLHEKFLQIDWLRAVVFQLNLNYLHVKITKPLRVVV